MLLTVSSPEKEREEEEFDLLGKGTFSFSIKENPVVNTLGHVGTSKEGGYLNWEARATCEKKQSGKGQLSVGPFVENLNISPIKKACTLKTTSKAQKAEAQRLDLVLCILLELSNFVLEAWVGKKRVKNGS